MSPLKSSTYAINKKNKANGNIITFYCTTGDTRIIFASNGITIISPKGYIESFTQGYMQRG